MKKIAYSELEKISAGGCDDAVALASTLLLAVAIASGPFGWAAVAAGAAAGLANGVNIGSECFT